MVLKIFLFGYGLILGSFYNVVGMRLIQGNFWDKTRSECRSCRKTLKWWELIPLLSYLVQRGKCRHCHKPISPIYPFVEFLTGLGFLLIYLSDGLSPLALFKALLTSVLIILSVSDMAYMKISNRFLFISFLVLTPISLAIQLKPLITICYSVLFTSVFMALFVLVNGEKMGMGDVKVFLLLSLFFSVHEMIYLFFLSSLIGLVVFLVQYLKDRQVKALPFVPMISLAASLLLLFS